MLNEEQLDELLDAYEEAFETLPLYKMHKPHMTEKKDTVLGTFMSSADSLARDIAYEIVLGGDRFDSYDVKPVLDGMTRAEMNFFKDRIRYHAVDFAPEEYRTDDFLSRMIEAWTEGVDVKESWEIRPEFQKMHDRQERGKWFRFADGGFRKCEKATVDCQWQEFERVGMVPEPISPFEVAREKADALISLYGRDVNLDGPVRTVDIISFGALESGYVMSVRRNVDALAEKPADHTYFITYTTPSGKSSTLLSHLPPEEMDRFIDMMDQEKQLRAGGRLGWTERSEPLLLPSGTVVMAPEPDADGVSAFEVKSLWENIDGEVIVSGHYAEGRSSGRQVSFNLGDFSDKGISVITTACLGQTLRQEAGLKENKSSSKKKNVSRSKGVE